MSEPKVDKRSKAYKESLKESSSSNFMESFENIPNVIPPKEIENFEITEHTSEINKAITMEFALPDIQKVKQEQEKTIKEPNKQYNMSNEITMPNKLVAPKLKDIKGKIAIKPYVSGEENMGLEKYEGEVLFPGVFQMDRLGCIDTNGFKTYFTGLDENAPEVQMLPEDKKIAKITSIRQVVAYLENAIGNNFKVNEKSCMKHYDTEDDKFWENVLTFKSSAPDKFDQKGNRIPTYWDSVELKLDNNGKQLDKSNPHDLVIYHAIIASGLGMVAPSLSVAMNSRGAYKFYLDQPEETADIKTEFKKLRNQAGAGLESMRLNDEARLFYMCKILAVQGSSMYHRGGPNYTPVNSQYDDLCRYIDGEAGDGKITAVKKFLEFYTLGLDELNRRAVIKDAIELHLIEPKGDGRMYYRNEPLGKTIEEMVAHVGMMVNEYIWVEIRDAVEKEWAS